MPSWEKSYGDHKSSWCSWLYRPCSVEPSVEKVASHQIHSGQRRRFPSVKSSLWFWNTIRFSIRSVAVIEPDQAKIFEYVARVDGYVQQLPAFPGKKFEGQIRAIDRRLDAMKRTTRVRIDLDNPEDQLRPGMFANVELKIDGGEGLTVPVDAVLPTGSRSLVFVDKGSGKLEPRFIRVGRSFTQIDANGEASYDEVLDGLSQGERVVSSANFLIDAESRIQGALKTWDDESETKGKSSPK
jgi:hypothetical protein